MAKVIQVIETIETRGTGKDESTILRGVKRYYTFDGELLAENDPCADSSIWQERTRLREALLKVRSYNEDIAAGRINYRPEDHIQVIDAALSSGKLGT